MRHQFDVEINDVNFQFRRNDYDGDETKYHITYKPGFSDNKIYQVSKNAEGQWKIAPEDDTIQPFTNQVYGVIVRNENS